VLSLIGRTSPDVITLEEVPPRWQEKLKLIEAAYPYRIVCPPPSHIGGVAILSRRPFEAGEEPRCYDRGALAIATVNFGGRPVSIAVLHLGWPWPFDQPDQLLDIAPVLETKLKRTALLAGDFNAVPWSETVRRVAEAGGLEVVRGIGPTWLEQGFPDVLRRSIGFPIDNVLAKGEILLNAPTRLDYVGSDHLPVLMEFGLKAEEEGAGAMQAELGQ
jgi:endonuclease/exonuclease/phosphatase (EEP) superfamily protein YafD